MPFNFVRWIRPHERLLFERADRERFLDKVFCFDLYEFEVPQAAGLVHDIRGIFSSEKYIEALDISVREVFAPCTVFLKPSRITLSTDDTLQVSEVGAVLYDYRRDSGDEGDRATLRALEKLDSRLGGGELTLDAATRASRPARRFEDPYAEADAADLGVFADPPYRLDQLSFDRLVKRMNMPDSSWDKDD